MMNLRFLASQLKISEQRQSFDDIDSLTVDRSFLSTVLFEPVLDAIALGKSDQDINKQINSIFEYSLNASNAYLIYNFNTQRLKPSDADVSDYSSYLKSMVIPEAMDSKEQNLTVTTTASLQQTFPSVATALAKRGVEYFILAPVFFHHQHLATLVIEQETFKGNSEPWDMETLLWVKRFVRVLCPLIATKKQRLEASAILEQECLLRNVFAITGHTFDESKMMRQLVSVLGDFFQSDCTSIVRLDSVSASTHVEYSLDAAQDRPPFVSMQAYQRQRNTFFNTLDCPSNTYDRLLQSLLVQPDSEDIEPYEEALNKHCGVMSHVCFPLLYRGLPYGVLYFSDRHDRNFTAQERELLDTITAQISNAFYQAELYKKTQEAYAEARLANRKKNIFMAGITHELRTPLNTIIAGSCMVGDGLLGEVNTKQEHYMNLIQRNGEHLLLMINELLDYSKIEAGKLSLTKNRVALRECITNAVDLMLPLMEEKGNVFSLVFDDNVPEYVEWDGYRIQQVITNLLSNAHKFTGAGNRISVHCYAKACDKDTMIHLDVRDEGCGISSSDQERIFNAFEQIDRPQTGSSEKMMAGTGLGLPIAKTIVASHQGSLSVVSKLGEGSCFKVVLPVGNVTDTHQDHVVA